MSKIAGRYEVTAKLGEGGMGVVYRAYDPHPMDREVAVKTLHHFADPLLLDLFYKECRALKSISHPNIVEIFDMGEFEESGHRRPFFVMPLLAVLYDRTAPRSVVTFTVRRDRGGLFSGGQRTKWVVAYQDDRNYVRLELSDDRLHRVEVIAGKERSEEIPHRIPKLDQVHLGVQVAGNRLVHQYMIPGRTDWQTFDVWTRANTFEGRFGFYLPGDDEIQLTNFEYTPVTTP